MKRNGRACSYALAVSLGLGGLAAVDARAQSSVGDLSAVHHIASNGIPTRPLYLYFVGQTPQGLRLYREIRDTTATENFGLVSLQALVNDRAIPADADYDNVWSGGSVINKVTVVGSVATVDMSVLHLRVDAAYEGQAINQIIWTLTANDAAIKTVIFRHFGQRIATFAGHVDTSGVFKRENSSGVLASVWVNSVGKILHNPIAMTGSACTFEAAVNWRLWKNGVLARRGSTLATCSCPTRGTWSVPLRDLPPALYTFVARDISQRDGSIISKDTKSFIVRASAQ